MSLDVSALDSMEYFNCGENQLTSLDVSACTSLWQLTTFPQSAGVIQVIQSGSQYVIDLGKIAGVDITNITAVKLMDGKPLPAGYYYDNTSGLLTIETGMVPVELKYFYDTKANRGKLDVPPYEEYGSDIITSTPDMEVYFTWVIPELLEVDVLTELNDGYGVRLADDGSVVYYQNKSTGVAFRVPDAELEDFECVR